MQTKLFALIYMICMMNASAQVTLPYSQDFEGTTFPPTGWQLFSGTNGANWIRDTLISGYGAGTACTSFDNFDTPPGSYYGIRLPPMNFSSVVSPYLRFEVAYATRPSASSDIFAWYWSDNGVSNWTLLQNYSDTALTSASPDANLFVPAANEWRTITLSLSSLAGKSFVRLAIEDDCANGNVIYFDHVIVFDSTATGVHNIEAADALQVYPSPFTSFITIAPSGTQQNVSKAELYNVTGALVNAFQRNNSGLMMDNLFDLPKGVYFIRIYLSEGGMLNRKVMKM